tara:strand:+ start:683 stop:1141 length:459 start_codon:yes stop_codon:yes gene_type:complete
LVKNKPEALSNCLIKFKKSWSDFDDLINLTDNWSNVVGPDLSKECKPLKIEKDILTIVANHPQWRQALIFNKHNLKESILILGIKLKNIRIIQNYEEESNKKRIYNNAYIWENHPSRIKNQNVLNCNVCDRPTPSREIERWGKCTFCWRKTI